MCRGCGKCFGSLEARMQHEMAKHAVYVCITAVVQN
jgi:hypothetical protein